MAHSMGRRLFILSHIVPEGKGFISARPVLCLPLEGKVASGVSRKPDDG